MPIYETRADEAQIDHEVSRLVQSGVPDEVAAALVPMLASGDVNVYSSALKWARENAALGLDLSDEGRAEVARVTQQAKALVNSARAEHGAASVPDFGQAPRMRYDPPEADLEAEAARRDPLTGRTMQSGFVKDQNAASDRNSDDLNHHYADVLTPDQAMSLDDENLSTWDKVYGGR